MKKSIKEFADKFLELSKNKPIRIISHHDTDGITSAAILAKTFKRINKPFSIKIVKGLDEEIIKKELKRINKEILLFSDLGSGSLNYFQDLKQDIFILDHHEINKENLNQYINIINPHLYEEENICGAGLCYFFSKQLCEEHQDLARLAIIGMVGDRHDSVSKHYKEILDETPELTIKKSLLIYPATRPLRKALEYSTSPYIPGVTGSQKGTLTFLRENNIPSNKSLQELTDEEVSTLITGIMLKRANQEKKEDIIGHLYLLKFFNTKEDARELSVLINACSRLGYSDIALSFCLENEKAKSIAQDIYTKYKQQLVSALNTIERIEKIKGNGFVIMNAEDKVQDTIIGTVTSILSSSLNYEEGTVLIGMAYNKDKIKVSARIAGREGRNLKEILERTIIQFRENGGSAEVGGHEKAAGCLIEKNKEQEFIQTLKQNLEIEVMKV
ncbi:MAG: DHH family phosphoesterase [Candidatus Nanoarchaeia archaeon]